MPAIWDCTVVDLTVNHDDLPHTADWPMRRAVAAAWSGLVGADPQGVASGWGRRYLGEAELAALENRAPDPRHYECWAIARSIVETAGGDAGPEWSGERQRWDAAVSALAELLYHNGRGAQ